LRFSDDGSRRGIQGTVSYRVEVRIEMPALDADGESNAQEQDQDDDAGDIFAQGNLGADKILATCASGLFDGVPRWKQVNHDRVKLIFQAQAHLPSLGLVIRRNNVRRGK